MVGILAQRFFNLMGVLAFVLVSIQPGLAQNPLQEIIDQAIATGESQVNIPPGEYRATEPLRLHHVSDLTILAYGVTLVQENRGKHIEVINAEELRIKGITLDHDPLPFTQATITAHAPDWSWLEARIHEGYPMDPVLTKTKVEVYEAETGLLMPNVHTLYDVNGEMVTEDVFRLFDVQGFSGKVEVGDKVVVKAGTISAHGVSVESSRFCTFKDVTMHTASSFAFIETGCRRNQYLGVQIIPGPASFAGAEPRLRSTNTDGIHSKFATIGPRIEDCRIERPGDDGIAISGEYSFVIEANGNSLIVVPKRDEEIQEGDLIRGFSEAGVFEFEAEVTGVTQVYGYDTILADLLKDSGIGVQQTMTKRYELTLDSTVSSAPGSFVYPINRIGNGYIIRNNYIGNKRARGMLIKAGDGLIEGNTIEYNHMGSIVLTPEIFWLGSGFSQSVRIINNTINHGSVGPKLNGQGAGVISVAAEVPGAFVPVGTGTHQAIEISGNRFNYCLGPHILATSIDGLTIKDNVLMNTHVEVRQHGQNLNVNPNAGISIINCSNVTLDGNMVHHFGGSAYLQTVNVPSVTGENTFSTEPQTFDTFQIFHQIGSAMEDDDQDGILNLFEYFSGLNPNVPDSTNAFFWFSQSLQRQVLNFFSAVGGRNDLLVEAQRSFDLDRWETFTFRYGSDPWTGETVQATPAETGREEVSVELPPVNPDEPLAFYRTKLHHLCECTDHPQAEDPVYDIHAPVFPVMFSEAEKAQQRVAGAEMIANLNSALTAYANGQREENVYAIPPGVYRIADDSHIRVRNVHDFTILAEDVEIVTETNDRLLQFWNSSDITLKGPLTFDSDPAIMSQGTILAVNAQADTIDVEVMEGYALDPLPGSLFTFTPDGTWIGVSHQFREVNEVTLLSAQDRILRLTLRDLDPTVHAVGNLVAFGKSGNDQTALVFPNPAVENLTLEDVYIYSGSLMWWGQSAGDWRFTRVKATRRPGTNRLVGSYAGQQSSHTGQGGSLTLDQCEVGYSHDDLLNIRGGGVGLFLTLEQESPRVAVLYGGDYNVGDRLSFYDVPSYVSHGSAKVVAVEPLTDPAYETLGMELIDNVVNYRLRDLGDVRRVTFDRDLQLEVADVVDNESNKPDSIHIRNSYFHDGTVRVMIQGYRNATFENNVFRRVNFGLWVCTDVWWWEGGMVDHVWIHNNLFEQTSYNHWRNSLGGAIFVGPDIPDVPVMGTDVYSSVHISCNRIVGSSTHAITVRNSRGVWIRNNDIENVSGAAVHLTSVADAVVEGNRFTNTEEEVVENANSSGIVIRDNTSL